MDLLGKTVEVTQEDPRYIGYFGEVVRCNDGIVFIEVDESCLKYDQPDRRGRRTNFFGKAKSVQFVCKEEYVRVIRAKKKKRTAAKRPRFEIRRQPRGGKFIVYDNEKGGEAATAPTLKGAEEILGLLAEKHAKKSKAGRVVCGQAPQSQD